MRVLSSSGLRRWFLKQKHSKTHLPTTWVRIPVRPFLASNLIILFCVYAVKLDLGLCSFGPSGTRELTFWRSVQPAWCLLTSPTRHLETSIQRNDDPSRRTDTSQDVRVSEKGPRVCPYEHSKNGSRMQRQGQQRRADRLRPRPQGQIQGESPSPNFTALCLLNRQLYSQPRPSLHGTMAPSAKSMVSLSGASKTFKWCPGLVKGLATFTKGTATSSSDPTRSANKRSSPTTFSSGLAARLRRTKQAPQPTRPWSSTSFLGVRRRSIESCRLNPRATFSACFRGSRSCLGVYDLASLTLRQSSQRVFFDFYASSRLPKVRRHRAGQQRWSTRWSPLGRASTKTMSSFSTKARRSGSGRAASAVREPLVSSAAEEVRLMR